MNNCCHLLSLILLAMDVQGASASCLVSPTCNVLGDGELQGDSFSLIVP